MLLLLPALLAAAVQQACPVVIDIDATPLPLSSLANSSLDSEVVPFAGELYFAAYHEAHGAELWAVDPASGATRLAAEMTPGPLGSAPRRLFVHAGSLYFTADDGVHGRELWRTSGTGATLVADIHPGPGDARTSQYVSFGGELYFDADDGAQGLELWKTDGTAAGTQLVADLNFGSGDSEPSSFSLLPSGAGFAFNARGKVISVEPYAFVGGAVQLLGDFNPLGAGVALQDRFVELGGELLFAAQVSGTSAAFYATDGTSAGTRQVLPPLAPGQGGAETYHHAVLGGFAYLAVHMSNGRELWRTDGTLAGTSQVAELAPGGASSMPSHMTTMGGEVYFFAETQASGSRSLYATQGTPATTRLVAALPAGGGGLSDPLGLRAIGGRLYFTAQSAGAGREVWTSDGTTAGTYLLADLATGAASGMEAEFGLYGMQTFVEGAPGDVVFGATGDGVGRELWRSDGSVVSLLAEIEAGVSTESSAPYALGVQGGALRFAGGSRADVGSELFALDPMGGATLLADIWPGPLDSSPDRFSEVWLGDRLVTFFRANVPGAGREPFVTDGTPAGTVMLGDLMAGVAEGVFSSFHGVGGRALFAGADLGHGVELFASDGTPAGTQLLADLRPGAASSLPQDLVVAGSQLFFTADDGVHGRELWVSDGTAAGTHLVADLNPAGNADVIKLTAVGDEVVFFARNAAATERPLWRSDGTGVTLVSDLGGALPSGPLGPLVELGGRHYFFAENGHFGGELWASDLTAAGTARVSDLAPLDLGVQADQLVATGTHLFFEGRVDGSGLGSELYVSDGTAGGTHLVAELAPGADSPVIEELTPVAGGVYFTAEEPVTGARELYFSDGLTLQQVCDPTPYSMLGLGGAEVSTNPQLLTLAAGRLYFVGSAPNAGGREVMALEAPGAFVLDLPGSTAGFVLHAPPAQLGGTVALTGELPPGSAALPGPVLIATSAPVAAPSTAFMQAGHALWLDPLAFALQAQLAGPSFGFAASVPNQPALVGAELNVQAFALDSVAPLAFVASNGLRLVIGP